MNSWVLSSTNIPCFWYVLGSAVCLGLWHGGLELVKKTRPHLSLILLGQRENPGNLDPSPHLVASLVFLDTRGDHLLLEGLQT